ncbi:Protein of unknown function [Cotesia congregata]|uniref:Uncharacterized protein n=1 Tax=Cotesia congregata TaxID=51543 RepID=A0A8J2MQ53_COTCN|nr:Protein of unknown function [Cotesia congregata]
MVMYYLSPISIIMVRKVCLMEEMRCIINNRPTKWGCKVIERLEEMEAVEVCRWIWEGGKEEAVVMKLKEGLDNWWKQQLEKEWWKIVDSEFNPLYKEILHEYHIVPINIY